MVLGRVSGKTIEVAIWFSGCYACSDWVVVAYRWALWARFRFVLVILIRRLGGGSDNTLIINYITRFVSLYCSYYNSYSAVY